MQLGTLISHLNDETDAAVALEALGNMALLAEVQTMGATFDETPGEYVSNAAQRFAAQADSEDWLALMSAMEYATDPGRAALDRMIRWALAGDAAEIAGPGPGAHAGCTCGAAAGGGHDCA